MWCPLGTEVTLVGSIKVLEGCPLCPCLLLNATPSLALAAKQMPHPKAVQPLGSLAEAILAWPALTPVPFLVP